MHFKNKRYIAILIFILVTGGALSQAQLLNNSIDQFSNREISHDEIIDKGLQIVSKENNFEINNATLLARTFLLKELEKWYTSHPMIEFASLVETTITIKFIDGTYTLLLDIFKLMNKYDTEKRKTFHDSIDIFLDYTSGKTTLILNPQVQSNIL